MAPTLAPVFFDWCVHEVLRNQICTPTENNSELVVPGISDASACGAVCGKLGAETLFWRYDDDIEDDDNRCTCVLSDCGDPLYRASVGMSQATYKIIPCTLECVSIDPVTQYVGQEGYEVDQIVLNAKHTLRTKAYRFTPVGNFDIYSVGIRLGKGGPDTRLRVTAKLFETGENDVAPVTTVPFPVVAAEEGDYPGSDGREDTYRAFLRAPVREYTPYTLAFEFDGSRVTVDVARKLDDRVDQSSLHLFEAEGFADEIVTLSREADDVDPEPLRPDFEAPAMEICYLPTECVEVEPSLTEDLTDRLCPDGTTTKREVGSQIIRIQNCMLDRGDEGRSDACNTCIGEQLDRHCNEYFEARRNQCGSDGAAGGDGETERVGKRGNPKFFFATHASYSTFCGRLEDREDECRSMGCQFHHARGCFAGLKSDGTPKLKCKRIRNKSMCNSIIGCGLKKDKRGTKKNGKRKICAGEATFPEGMGN